MVKKPHKIVNLPRDVLGDPTEALGNLRKTGRYLIRSKECIECYSCANVSALASCNTVTNCPDGSICSIDLLITNGQKTYTLGCNDISMCLGVMVPTHPPAPVGRSTMDRRDLAPCSDCCSVSNCNRQLCQTQDSSCTNQASYDCSAVGSSINICADTDHAKLKCRHFCGLCSLKDGGWSDWSPWSACTASCAGGTQTRIRSCSNPPPQDGGEDCSGPSLDTQACAAGSCPVQGIWGTWHVWGACSSTCDIGLQKRLRMCTFPPTVETSGGERPCDGEPSESRLCFSDGCVDGGWGGWGAWSACSHTCGDALRSRSRACDNPPRSVLGRDCPGDSSHSELCTITPCQVSLEIYCAQNMGQTLENPANCAQYIDCSPRATTHPQFGRHMTECPYPKLYSTQTSRCESFEQVLCGTRYEPRAPCEYVGTIGTGTLENCMATYYSCVGLPDGANPIPGGQADTQYLMCQSERTIEIKTCPDGNTYDPAQRICTQTTAQGVVEKQCMQNPLAILPDMDHCARYHNCSLTVPIAGLAKYQMECDYPLLFNIQTLSCEEFNIVQCYTRFEPKAPCDYLSTTTKCEGPLCALPCLERSPSCVGMPDGNNTYPTRDLSPFYMTCLGERTVSVGICRFGVYDPILRACTTELDPGSIQAYCLKNPTGVIPYYTNCARYYNCSSGAVMSGGNSFLHKCLYPQLFNLDTMACEPYQTVQCTFRFEPKGPCEYLQNQVCPPGTPNCLPCARRIPSCAGLENGNNSFVGRDSFYIVCQDERTLYARECVGGSFDPLTRACKEQPPVLDFDASRPSQYCTMFPRAVVPSPLSCAQYFDCSNKITSLGNYKHECPYPQLYDRQNGCVPFNMANCELIFEPVDPCEYEANLRCTDQGPCLPCNERYVSCKVMPNGNYSIAGRPSEFKVCMNERTVDIQSCPSGGMYDSTTGTCQISFDTTNPTPYCTVYPNALLQNPENCAQFYDCRQKNTMFGNYLRECPYLQLYSDVDKTCHSFDRVQCGLRPEPKVPCDYLQNNQCYDPAGCPPCIVNKPSCVGLPDGNNTFPDRPREYIVCAAERAVGMEVCQFQYDTTLRQCGRDMSNPNIFCEVRPAGALPHPTRCAQYYDCRLKTAGQFREPHLTECPYPALFDEATGRCQDFINVNCGTRKVPVAPCDYMANTCVNQGPGCVPCSERYVSCVGRPDGNNSYPGQEMMSRYITCQQERPVGEAICGTGYFDPVRRICATRLDSVSIQMFCQQNPGVIMANPLNCAQYFDCSPKSVSEGTFLRECPYPMLFSKETLVCQNFTSVTCGLRMEPVEPCQYLQNVCDPRSPGCVPCQQKFPSCTGLPDGNNVYPGKEMTEEYVVCLAGRTLSSEKCASGVFFPDKRECGEILDERMASLYCQSNPTTILAHQTNCAQYYDCRRAVGGSYLRECRYPQLFDEAAQTCKNFSDVTCGIRFEPQAPCEYLQTQCLQNDANCTPCDRRLPSCIGLPDGNNPFPTRPNSQYYVRCFRNRTVAVEVCQVSLFDPATRECSSVIDPSVLSGFCQENPSVLIPDPQHCARYYNCSDPTVKQGLGVPHLQECKYPRLFGYGATSCKLFTDISCGERYEAKAPCEYVENQCFNATCPPCETNFPTCVGKQDGSNNFPGRVGSEYYIVCYRDRTVAIVTCTSGFYNHSSRTCEANSRPGAAGTGGQAPAVGGP